MSKVNQESQFITNQMKKNKTNNEIVVTLEGLAEADWEKGKEKEKAGGNHIHGRDEREKRGLEGEGS